MLLIKDAPAITVRNGITLTVMLLRQRKSVLFAGTNRIWLIIQYGMEEVATQNKKSNID